MKRKEQLISLSKKKKSGASVGTTVGPFFFGEIKTFVYEFIKSSETVCQKITCLHPSAILGEYSHMQTEH